MSNSVRVVVELNVPKFAGSPPSIQGSREAFERVVSVVEPKILQAGATVVDRAWINGTLSVDIPLNGSGDAATSVAVRELAKALADLHEVRLISPPSPITRDGNGLAD